MGYSTEFTGKLTFKNEVTGKELAALSQYLGVDRRDIGFESDSVYECGEYGSYWFHIDFELTDDFSGIQWNKVEKFYQAEHIVNWITARMHDLGYEDFYFEGELLAQGERFDDRWRLVMSDGIASKVEFPKIGQRLTCPYCEEEFILEE